MRVDLDDGSYEELWLNWQYEIAVLLKDALSKSRIKGDTAHEIVGRFLFDFSMMHDQIGIEVDGRTYVPRIGFVNENSVLVTSAEESSLHEAAFGNADEAFGR